MTGHVLAKMICLTKLFDLGGLLKLSEALLPHAFAYLTALGLLRILTARGVTCREPSSL